MSRRQRQMCIRDRSPVAQVEAGAEASHTCFVDALGGVSCFGDNGYGQLGDNSKQDRRNPVSVVGLNSNVTKVTTGRLHTCALLDNGSVMCWGEAADGRLGNGVLVQDLNELFRHPRRASAPGGTRSTLLLVIHIPARFWTTGRSVVGAQVALDDLGPVPHRQRPCLPRRPLSVRGKQPLPSMAASDILVLS